MNTSPHFATPTRRSCLQTAGGLGVAALSSLLQSGLQASQPLPAHRAPSPVAKAKRIIYLFQSGAPSQMDLFDPKPEMASRPGEICRNPFVRDSD
jgi:hypothetical protein